MLETLWVMRHGLAENEFSSDFSRPLSSIGESQTRNVVQQLLKKSDKLPTSMLVSPFSRTQSTAQIVHNMLGLSEPFKTDEMLVHFADHKILGDFLMASNYRDLIIVSHMPIVASLCQYLVPNCDIYGFQTAQLTRIDFNLDPTQNPVGKITKTYLPIR